MAIEINESGYESFRQAINSSLTAGSQWDYIELFDDNNNIVTRVSVTGDSRFSWTTKKTDQTQEATGTVSGSDSDISTPVTLVGSRLKAADSDTADVKHEEGFSDALIENDSDYVKIIHQVEVPQV